MGVMDLFIILTVAMISQIHAYIKTQTVWYKNVQFIVQKLYLIEVALF